MEPIVLAPPRPADPSAAERGWRRWEALPGGEARDAAKEAAREPPWPTVLDGLFGGSPFLSEALLAGPELRGRRGHARGAWGASPRTGRRPPSGGGCPRSRASAPATGRGARSACAAPAAASPCGS